MRERELEPGDRAAGTDDPRELVQRDGGIVHVAEEIGEREGIERRVGKRQLLRASLDERDACRHAPPCLGQHLRALVETDHGATRLPDSSSRRDRSRSRRDVQHGLPRAHVDARDEEAAPARILAEGQQRRIAVVRRPERGEQRPRGDGPCHEAEFMLGRWR